jgi:hypothetical protein
MNSHNGLSFVRLMMVLSGMSPLFVLWAVRGSALIDEQRFLAFCACMIVVPNLVLLLRMRKAEKLKEYRPIKVIQADDHREHLLVYLFAMLLPLYSSDIDTLRGFAAALVALSFIVFLFWHLNLHYMNLLFAVGGYHVFTVHQIAEEGALSGTSSVVLITKRSVLPPLLDVVPLRLSNTVYLER